MDKQRIILRADGNAEIGLGHVSRCLALAEALPEDFHTILAIQQPDAYILPMLKSSVAEVIQLGRTRPSSAEYSLELDPYLSGDEIVVLDGYTFTRDYEQRMKDKVRAVVSIDDIPNRHFVADAVINFSGGVNVTDYSKEFYTQLFLGLDFLFLRSPFLRVPQERKKMNDRLFLNMGGTDFNNHTARILNEISGFQGKIEIVIGDGYAHAHELEAMAKGNKKVEILRGLGAEEMFACMKRCAYAIVPPSTVSLEFLSTGGIVFLYQTAANQAVQGKYLMEAGLAFDYSNFWPMVSAGFEPVIDRTAKLQEKLFDGSSLNRIRKVFGQIGLSSRVRLRRATADDMSRCYQWANDPEVRKYSYAENRIAREEHVRWFHRKLTDPNCYYFVAENEEFPVGQMRFDLLEDGAFQISYSLDENWRGKGLGYYLLVKGVKELNLSTAAKRIIGYVREINIPSIRAFQKAGFKMLQTDKYADSIKFELLLNAE